MTETDSSAFSRTPEEYREWWAANTDVPYGTCWCGCGKETKPADRTHPNCGVKGEPRRYIQTHYDKGRPMDDPGSIECYRREWLEARPDVPYGLCWCGCGEKTTPAKGTDARHGYVQGEPKRYVIGHRSRGIRRDFTEARAEHRRDWEHDHPDVPYGYCVSGCGEKTALSPQSDKRRGLVNGAPYKRHSWVPYADSQDRAIRIRRSKMVHEERRRARELNAEGSYTPEEVWQMVDDQDGLCAYCETPLFGRYHIDHMIPLSRGGRNDWTNLAISCPECNFRKNARTAEEFVMLLE